MTTLVLGATGATGKLVVEQLLSAGEAVIALVRRLDVLAPHANLQQVNGTALDMSAEPLAELVAQSTSIVCCLGHNVTCKGMYGAPRMLVRDSLARVLAYQTNQKVVLMNSSGVRLANEKVSIAQRVLIALIRVLLPPHKDNEQAMALLAASAADFVIVRPDGLLTSSPPSRRWLAAFRR